MTRRQQQRQRHRVERQVEEAFAALENGDLALARKLALRARTDGAVNPRVLHDCAEILRRCGDAAAAEDALRAAITLAPNYADAFAALAELQAAAQKWPAALRLQARAAELRPGDDLLRLRLAALREAAAAHDAEAGPLPVGDHPQAPEPDLPAWAATLAASSTPSALAAAAVALRSKGAVVVASGEAPALPDREAAALRGAFTTGHGMEAEWREPPQGEGPKVRYRWFLAPLPPAVAALQAALWLWARALAEDQRCALGDEPAVPVSLAAWQAAAIARGRRRLAVRVLRLEPGAGLLLDRDPDRRAFPLRALVAFGGSVAVALADLRPGRKVREREVEVPAGGILLLPARDRLVPVAGTFGWQPVQARVLPAPAERWLLDLPFEGAG